MQTAARTTKKVIALNIDIISYSKALGQIVSWGISRTNSYICFANVHMTIEAHRNVDLAKKINAANLVLADGVPLLKTLDFFYNVHQERVAGMDIFPDIVREAEKQQLKIFFFGGTDEVLEKIRIKTEKLYPKILIAGLFSPSFEKSLDDEAYIEMINASDAHLVFVALGCPKQEFWMAKHSSKINSVLLGVGGAFPVYSGVVKRAPIFIRNYSLEWLYRLFQEPGRLFKRYLTTNPLFIWLVIKQRIFSARNPLTTKG